MPIKHSIWTVGGDPASLTPSQLATEQVLEEMIVSCPDILSNHWLLIGQQVHTTHGGFIDLLAIDTDGNLIVIELKRNKTPREVVAQALDYASWVKELQADAIAEIFDRFKLSQEETLDASYEKKFGHALDEETLNDSHQIVVVASSLDPSTERIVNYLNDLDVAINVLFFQVFQHGSEQLLSRTWLVDPIETTINATAIQKGPKEPWNGEFYISFGHTLGRDWEEAREYNFISAGGGPWYSRTLEMLKPGDRIWVNVPKIGYVGVGTVKSPAVQARDFPPLNQLKADHYHRHFLEDPENCEYFVEVDWLKTVPLSQAYREIGFFGNQNTVCKPTSTRWQHTIKKLKRHFGISG